MIADFGLSRVMPDTKLSMLTEVCGTPGVSSFLAAFQLAEMLYSTWHQRFSKGVSFSLDFAWHLLRFIVAGHGMPVDVWAMGVITYFLLAGTCGHTCASADSSNIHC